MIGLRKPRYHWKVWLTFSILTLVVGLVHYALKRSHNISGPNGEKNHTCTAGKILRFFYFITLALFLGLYTNLLAINLSQVDRKPVLPFTTGEQLARKVAGGDCKMVGYEMSDFREAFPTAESRNYTYLSVLFYRAQHVHAPTDCRENQHCMVEYVMQGSKRDCRVGVDYRTKTELLKVEYPELEIVEDESFLPIRNVYFYGRFLSDCQKELIGVAFQSGSPSDLYRRLVKEYARQKALRMYLVDNRDRHGPKTPAVDLEASRPIELDQVKDTFFFFSVGIVGSSVVFAITLVANRRHAAHVGAAATATVKKTVSELHQSVARQMRPIILKTQKLA